MADDYDTTRETRADGSTTIVHETRRSGGGAGWAIAVLLLVALIAGFWLFNQSSRSEIAKDNAITSAATKVGNAAESVGEAAKDAADGAR